MFLLPSSVRFPAGWDLHLHIADIQNIPRTPYPLNRQLVPGHLSRHVEEILLSVIVVTGCRPCCEMPRCLLEHTTHLVNVSFVIDIVLRPLTNERLFNRVVADNRLIAIEGSIHIRAVVGGRLGCGYKELLLYRTYRLPSSNLHILFY